MITSTEVKHAINNFRNKNRTTDAALDAREMLKALNDGPIDGLTVKAAVTVSVLW